MNKGVFIGLVIVILIIGFTFIINTSQVRLSNSIQSVGSGSGEGRCSDQDPNSPDYNIYEHRACCWGDYGSCIQGCDDENYEECFRRCEKEKDECLPTIPGGDWCTGPDYDPKDKDYDWEAHEACCKSKEGTCITDCKGDTSCESYCKFEYTKCKSNVEKPGDDPLYSVPSLEGTICFDDLKDYIYYKTKNPHCTIFIKRLHEVDDGQIQFPLCGWLWCEIIME